MYLFLPREHDQTRHRVYQGNHAWRSQTFVCSRSERRGQYLRHSKARESVIGINMRGGRSTEPRLISQR